MEKKTKIEQFDIFNALPELCILIFTFLPVRSLVILRSVCKWFLSIIDDPEFVKLHLHHFPSNVLQNRFLYTDTINRPYYSAFLISSRADEEFIDYVYPITTVDGESSGSLLIESSLDGLLLLSTTLSDNFLLWNPSMRKHRWTTTPLDASLPIHDLEYSSLGYDRASEDYKVFAMSSLHKAYVYSVKKGSWTALVVDKNKVGGRHGSYNDPLSTNDGILLHEMGSKPNKCTTIWFDCGTEAFCYGNHGPIDMKNGRWALMKLDGGSTAGMWGYNVDDQLCIWALEICTMSWRKHYKVSREMMPRRISMLSYIERNEELLWKYRGDNVIEELTYDIKTQMIKRHIKKPCVGYCDTFFIESMIIL